MDKQTNNKPNTPGTGSTTKALATNIAGKAQRAVGGVVGEAGLNTLKAVPVVGEVVGAVDALTGGAASKIAGHAGALAVNTGLNVGLNTTQELFGGKSVAEGVTAAVKQGMQGEMGSNMLSHAIGHVVGKQAGKFGINTTDQAINGARDIVNGPDPSKAPGTTIGITGKGLADLASQFTNASTLLEHMMGGSGGMPQLGGAKQTGATAIKAVHAQEHNKSASAPPPEPAQEHHKKPGNRA
ncbi:MAG: hypothetical protein V4490_07860 [Pseudomonadota bacterium]